MNLRFSRMVKVEFFTAEPPCAGCVELLRLADELAEKYGDRLEVIKHVGPCKEFDEYGLTVVPAVVFEGGRIMLMGVCPDMETLTASLKELGV
jgi:thiol-disulfide isomerase/thioredoxin